MEQNLTESGFSFNDKYAVENVTGFIKKKTFEEVDFESQNLTGMITFSTGLNSKLANAGKITEKVKYFFESKWKSFLNSLNISDRLKKIFFDKYQQPEYTLVRYKKNNYFFKGKNGMTLKEKSITVEIAGIDSDVLIIIASEICRVFKQKTVLLRDFKKSKTFLVNGEK